MVRKAETFPPVTMGHIRGHGCRDFAVGQNAFQRAMAWGKDGALSFSLPHHWPARSGLDCRGRV